MSGKFALIIANTEYTDTGLAQLTAPGRDAEDFERVLRDKEVCAFDQVDILLNQPEYQIREAIYDLFNQKKPDDLILLYFSGHGVRDEYGALYLAVKNTMRSKLGATAVDSSYITRSMDQSRSKRQVLILDCCNSGAFAQGTKAATGVSIGTKSAFEGRGYGRVVLTASDSTQFAWEGDTVTGETDNSLFTHFLVTGLKGEADKDGDGRITIDELYDYTYEQIVSITPKQTPGKWSYKQQGEIVLRQSTRIEDIKPVPLPPYLINAIENPDSDVRLGAIQSLARLLTGKNVGLARAARDELERIEREDDSRRASQAANQALEPIRQAEQSALKKAEEERQAAEEAERLFVEQKEEEQRKARAEAERLENIRAEEKRIADEKAEAEQKAKKEAKRLAALKAKQERLAREKGEADRKAKQDAEEERRVQQKVESELKRRTDVAQKVKKEEQPPTVQQTEREIPHQEKAKAQKKPSNQVAVNENILVRTPRLKPATLAIAIIALGLFGYGATRLFQSILDATPTPDPQTPATEAPAPSSTELPVSGPAGPKSPDTTTYSYVKSSLTLDTLDPALSYFSNDAEIIRNIYETLMFYEGENPDQFVALLAEDYDVSADGTVYTFIIRDGVKFHQGGELTASDVAYSFQRGILQGGTSSPQFLLAEPLLGIGIQDISLLVDSSGNLYDDRAALQAYDTESLISACERVKSAIVADDSTGKVTLHLAQPWAAFMATLAGPWGSIMDKEWVVDNGGWDGSCNSWQDYYAMTYEEDPFSTIANGTGPFLLDVYSNGEEISLVRHNDYWREPARLEKINITAVSDWNARLSFMQAGEADTIEVPNENPSDLSGLVGESCEFDRNAESFKPCEIIDLEKPLRVYEGQPNYFAYAILFNFEINTDGGNPYLGSGALDGNGMPPHFFADVHIRKAFAYCFDWETYIAEAYSNNAIQAYQLIPYGTLGYDRDAPHYEFDLAKCEEEFKQADIDRDGIPASTDPDDIWKTGFRFQFAYNEGNTVREPVGEILAQNLRSVNDNFQVEVLGLPFSTYSQQLRDRRIPIMLSAWAEDIRDPHNYFPVYLTGSYGDRQSLPAEIVEQADPLLIEGIKEMNPGRRVGIYSQLSQLYYDEAIGLPLAWPTYPVYEQRWVQGRIFNPAFQGMYFYTIHKD